MLPAFGVRRFSRNRYIQLPWFRHRIATRIEPDNHSYPDLKPTICDFLGRQHAFRSAWPQPPLSTAEHTRLAHTSVRPADHARSDKRHRNGVVHGRFIPAAFANSRDSALP